MTNKYRIIFMGTSFFAGEVLKELKNLNLDIIKVVTQQDSRIGRKMLLTKTPVKLVAESLDLEVLQPVNISNAYEEILALAPDFIVTCAYGQFVPNKILNIPKLAINIHASFLPKLRGGAPIHWAVINGDSYSGITIMKMVKKMDAGPIFVQKKVAIDKNDTKDDLEIKLINLSRTMIKENLLDVMDGKYPAQDQNENMATFGFNVGRDDEKIDFNNSCEMIYNKIRGLYKKPGAFAYLDDIVCKIYKADFHLEDLDHKIKNGTIINLNKDGIIVKVKDGTVILKEIQLAGKNLQETKWFFKNAPKNIYVGAIYE